MNIGNKLQSLKTRVASLISRVPQSMGHEPHTVGLIQLINGCILNVLEIISMTEVGCMIIK